MKAKNVEVRTVKRKTQLRTTTKGHVIGGYAAKFAPSRSQDLGGFTEQLDAHCFDKSLASPNLDCRCLFNHDANLVIGRTPNTLRLRTDSTVLFYECDLDLSQTYSNDLFVSMTRGDVTQSSFGFICSRDAWHEQNGLIVRTVLEAELFDVSPVTFPAYEDATSGILRSALRTAPASIRAKLADLGEDPDDGNDDDDDNDECRCTCMPCTQDNCRGCLGVSKGDDDNQLCTDEFCDGCPMQDTGQRALLLNLRRRLDT